MNTSNADDREKVVFMSQKIYMKKPTSCDCLLLASYLSSGNVPLGGFEAVK